MNRIINADDERRMKWHHFSEMHHELASAGGIESERRLLAFFIEPHALDVQHRIVEDDAIDRPTLREDFECVNDLPEHRFIRLIEGYVHLNVDGVREVIARLLRAIPAETLRETTRGKEKNGESERKKAKYVHVVLKNEVTSCKVTAINSGGAESTLGNALHATLLFSSNYHIIPRQIGYLCHPGRRCSASASLLISES